MINTKKEGLTPQQRKDKIIKLREEHQNYFTTIDENALYIPKMAYRPQGKDDLYVSFFPSELEKECNIYTEFVSTDYETEDPKRTLYLVEYNPHWRDDYELVESNSGFQRHFIPVSQLKIINDVVTRSDNNLIFEIDKLANPSLPNPDEIFSYRGLVEVLQVIANTLEKIEKKIK